MSVETMGNKLIRTKPAGKLLIVLDEREPSVTLAELCRWLHCHPANDTCDD